MPTQTEDTKSITFRSADHSLVLVRKPERRRYNEAGELEILEGKRYVFDRGILTGLDPDDVEWLRNHYRLNQKFVEVGNEPDREKPTVTEAMTEIAKAAAQQDATAIAAIYQREIETYDREPVKDAASQALVALEELAEEGGQSPAGEEAAPEED